MWGLEVGWELGRGRWLGNGMWLGERAMFEKSVCEFVTRTSDRGRIGRQNVGSRERKLLNQVFEKIMRRIVSGDDFGIVVSGVLVHFPVGFVLSNLEY